MALGQKDEHTPTPIHTHTIGKHVIALTANLNEILLLPLPSPLPPYSIQATQKFEAKAKTSMCHKADDSSPGSLCVRLCVCGCVCVCLGRGMCIHLLELITLALTRNQIQRPRVSFSLGSSCKTQLARCQFAAGAGIEASTYFIERY